MTIIIDYGMGNLGSISNMLKKNGHHSIITSDTELIKKASKLILPGVGAFDSGMKRLEELGLVEILNQRVIVDNVPILGICLGIQLMTKSSEEGSKSGLSWFDATTKKFELGNLPDKYPLPNMGWRQIQIIKEIPLFEDLDIHSWFYFVHTYFIESNCHTDVAMSSSYGTDFTACLARGNILGVQFHPEKSHKFGMQLLNNFIKYY